MTLVTKLGIGFIFCWVGIYSPSFVNIKIDSDMFVLTAVRLPFANQGNVPFMVIVVQMPMMAEE